MSFLSDVRFALRSFARAKGLAATVIITLALGIGANAAIFSVVRGVLLRPLANRDEERLIYIRQTRKRDRRRQHQLFGARDPGPAGRRPHADRHRRLFDDRVHDDRPRRATRRPGRGRRRVLFRGHGPAPGARSPDRSRRRRPERGGRGRADPSLLVDHAEGRLGRPRTRPSASATARPRSSASSSRRCRTRRRPRSSPMS